MDLHRDHFVCADAGLYRKGKYVANLGVAVEFRDYEEFRGDYFTALRDVSAHHGVTINRRVIKGSDIYQVVPDHLLREYVDELTSRILGSENISHIQVTHTILQQDVLYPWRPSPILGVRFVEAHLANYYPIIPLYEYYYNGGSAESAVLDGITGFITRAWLELARSATEGVYIVPHGDETHPCLSLCDLAILGIKQNVYPLREESALAYLSSVVHDSTTVHSNFITDGLIDLMRARYPYDIKPHKYYLHPLFIIDRGKEFPEAIVRNSDIYGIAHDLAETVGGSSFFIKAEDQWRILREGDVIVCLSTESYERMLQLGRLNPVRNIGIFDVEHFVGYAEELSATVMNASTKE